MSEPITIRLRKEQIELLSYMANRYECTVDGLIEDAIHDYYADERKWMREKNGSKESER